MVTAVFRIIDILGLSLQNKQNPVVKVINLNLNRIAYLKLNFNNLVRHCDFFPVINIVCLHAYSGRSFAG